MNRSRTLTLAAAIATVLAAGAAPVPAQSGDSRADVEYGDGYRAGDYGRVRYHDNGLTVQRAAAEQPLPADPEALLNAPIYPGDAVFTGPRQRAEIELADGAAIRIDENSEVTFLALPSPYSEFRDNTVLQLAAGTLRIDAEPLGQEEFRIDTPAASVYLLGSADVRIEVVGSDLTRVASRRGVVELVGDDGSVLVRGGMQAEVWAGQVPGRAAPFNTFTADSFDRWVERRDAAYRTNDRYAGAMYEQLPDEVRPYYGELSRHGNWAYVDDYGYVWSPTGVPTDWRPYRQGYWDYGPHGYFWVSNEPWGWAPYHYGRWTWVGGRGWCWVPARVFAGAWVAWSWGSVHVGWSPLDYWGYPCTIGSRGYYGYDPYAWTFVNYNHFGYHHVSRYAVSVTTIQRDLPRQWISTRPPAIGPARLAASEADRARAVRAVQADSGARLAPRRADATRSARALPEVERSLRSDRAALRRTAAPGRGGESDGRAAARYPRRISSPGNGQAGEPGRARPAVPGQPGRGRVPGADSPGRGSGATGIAPRNTDDRVRDLYDRMAEPRRTRERPADRSAAPGAGGRGSGEARPTPTRERTPTPQARPRPGSSPARGSTPAPKPRDSSATPKPRDSSATPRSTGSRRDGASSGRRTQPRREPPKQDRDDARRSAAPRSSGARVERPSATPRRSAPSRPSAAPSRSSGSRSGGSKATPRRSAPSRPSAAPSRSSGSRSGGSKATPRRSAPSRPSAAPSRSSGSRSGGSKATPRRSAPSRPSAAPSRSSGSRSGGSKATPRRSAPSRPSAAPSRSSGSRSGGSKATPRRSAPSRPAKGGRSRGGKKE